MMKKIFLIASLMFGSFIVFPISNFALDEASGDIKMYVGQTKNISVNNPTRIVVGNPVVADVSSSVSKSELTVNAKSSGYTTLVVWDNFGENSYMVRVYAENMNEYKRRIDNLLKKLNIPGVFTKAEDEEAKVYLEGELRNAQEKERMSTALGDLKAKTVDLTSVKDETIIEIDVQVLELTKGATDTLGFSWPGSATLDINDAASKAVATLSGVPFSQLFTFDRWNRASSTFSFKVDMLIEEGKARILSRPRMSCQSSKEAKLVVGGEVPILSSSMAGGGAVGGGSPSATPGSIEYKEYGIVLKIKPVVDDKKRIHINLNVEVSELGDLITTTYAAAYTFTKRNAETELWVNDGETMAIGGLIKQRNEETVRKFPWLADLPMIGGFFRQKISKVGGGINKGNDSELFITLTPHIVKDASPEVKPKAKEPPVAFYPPAQESEAALDPAARYSRVIQQRIMENVIYPQQARDAGFQGTTRLNIKLSYRGELLDAAVKKSSGYKLLDDNALAAAKSTAIYPPFPPAIPQEELWIEVPVSYQLE